MKIKRNGKIVEVEDDYTLKDGEEAAKDEDLDDDEDEDTKKFSAIIDKKLKVLLQDLKDNPDKGAPALHKDVEVLERSIMETDAYRRSKRPFVKLSNPMVSFVKDVRIMAKGGTPVSMAKGMTEGDDTAGGFTVPEEFNAEVIRYVEENAVVRPRARVFNMTRDTLTMPKLDQSSDGFGGITLYWPEEAAVKTATNPTFGKITLSAKKLIGLCPISDELLADSAVNLANFIVTLFGEAIAYEEDKQFIQGTGMGKPLGIINTVGINSVARNTSTKILINDINGMYAALPAWADNGAVWLTNKTGLGQLIAIQATTTGVLLFLSNLRDAVSLTLLGKPIVLTEKCKTLGTAGDIILGNLNYYFIGDRGALEVAASQHDRFRYDETTFRFVKRVDGQPSVAKAFVVLGT